MESFSSWLLLSSCYSARQQLLIPPLLLLPPVIDKNTPLSSGELNSAELFHRTTTEDATTCYWGAHRRGMVSMHTLAKLSKDGDKQSLRQLFPYAEHSDRN